MSFSAVVVVVMRAAPSPKKTEPPAGDFRARIDRKGHAMRRHYIMGNVIHLKANPGLDLASGKCSSNPRQNAGELRLPNRSKASRFIPFFTAVAPHLPRPR